MDSSSAYFWGRSGIHEASWDSQLPVCFLGRFGTGMAAVVCVCLFLRPRACTGLRAGCMCYLHLPKEQMEARNKCDQVTARQSPVVLALDPAFLGFTCHRADSESLSLARAPAKACVPTSGVLWRAVGKEPGF